MYTVGDGMAGDTVECRDGRVRLNGADLDEPYLTDGARTNCDTVTVPADSRYVLGQTSAVLTNQ